MIDKTAISLASFVVRCNDIVEAEVDGELVALNVETGTCYGLNKVGTRIWKIIDAPCRVEELCDRLIQEFEVDRETCLRDVAVLLEEMSREKLIDVTAPSSGA